MFGLLAGSATWGLFWGAWAALLPGIGQQVSAGPAELGSALFAVPVGALPAMLGMGPVFDRYGRPAFGVVLLLFAAASALPGYGSGPLALAGALLLVGAASGAIEVGLNAATATEERVTGRRLFNRIHAVTPIAMILAAPLAGAAREAGIAPKDVLLVVAALAAASALPNLAARPLSAPAGSGTASASSTSASSTSAQPTMAWRKTLRPSRTLAGYGLAAAVVLFVENAVEQWSAVLLDRDLGTGAFVASLGPAGYMAALALGRLTAQRYGMWLTPRRALVLAGACGAAGLGLAAVASHPVPALAGFVLAGLGAAPALPTLLAAVGGGVDSPGTAIATVTTVSYLGFLASPAVVGQTAGVVGLPVALGGVAGLGALLAAVVAVRGRVRPAGPAGP